MGGPLHGTRREIEIRRTSLCEQLNASNKHSDLISNVNLQNTLPLIWEVTCVNTLGKSSYTDSKAFCSSLSHD